MKLLTFSMKRILAAIPSLLLTSMVVFTLFMMMPVVMGTDYDFGIIWLEYKKWVMNFYIKSIHMRDHAMVMNLTMMFSTIMIVGQYGCRYPLWCGGPTD